MIIDVHGHVSEPDSLDPYIDLQIISPRPYTLMYSEEPPQIVQWPCEETNNVIGRVCERYPSLFRALAGILQSPFTEPDAWTGELRRCVGKLGSVEALLNPTIAVANLLALSVATDFSELKLIVSHGGRATPDQIGCVLAGAARDGATFRDELWTLYVDTCYDTVDEIELLARAVGVDRCWFGSEKPGTGSFQKSETVRWCDDIKVLGEEITCLAFAS